jgi:hypothetical protein
MRPRQVPGKCRTPRAASLKAVRRRPCGCMWLPAPTGMTRVAHRPRAATDDQHPRRNTRPPDAAPRLAFKERHGRRERAAGIVTRKCRDAAGGSVARAFPFPRDRARPPEDLIRGRGRPNIGAGQLAAEVKASINSRSAFDFWPPCRRRFILQVKRGQVVVRVVVARGAFELGRIRAFEGWAARGQSRLSPELGQSISRQSWRVCGSRGRTRPAAGYGSPATAAGGALGDLF